MNWRILSVRIVSYPPGVVSPRHAAAPWRPEFYLDPCFPTRLSAIHKPWHVLFRKDTVRSALKSMSNRPPFNSNYAIFEKRHFFQTDYLQIHSHSPPGSDIRILSIASAHSLFKRDLPKQTWDLAAIQMKLNRHSNYTIISPILKFFSMDFWIRKWSLLLSTMSIIKLLISCTWLTLYQKVIR